MLDSEDWAVPFQIRYQCSILGFIYSCKGRTWRRVLDVFCSDARNLPFLKHLFRWREYKRSIWGREWSLHAVSVGGKGPFEGMTSRYWCSFRVCSMVSQSFLRWAAIDRSEGRSTARHLLSRYLEELLYTVLSFVYIYFLKNWKCPWTVGTLRLCKWFSESWLELIIFFDSTYKCERIQVWN